MKPRILFLTIALCIIFVFIFFIPAHVENFALIYEKVVSGEIWRFITYQFSHLDLGHLIENLIGILLVGIIAAELKIEINDFSIIYFLAGTFAIIPIWLLMKFTALGASAAIYAVFGIIAFQAKEFEIKTWHVFLFLTLIIFLKSFFQFFNCGFCKDFILVFRQAMSHFSGLIFGFFGFILLRKIKYKFYRKKLFCLRGE